MCSVLCFCFFLLFLGLIHIGRVTRSEANGTCCHQWECSHCTQARSKEKRSNLHAHRIARPVWIRPQFVHPEAKQPEVFHPFAIATRSSAEATAVRGPPPLSLPYVYIHCIWPKWPLETFSGSHGGRGTGSGTKFLSEPQNGCPAVTARRSDHKWTSHNEQTLLVVHSLMTCHRVKWQMPNVATPS